MTKIPSTGVTISAVADALHTTQTSLSKLCSHENVNMFARFKPFAFASETSPTFQEKRDAHFGNTVISNDSIQLFCDAIDMFDGVGVTWDKPVGKSMSPFRLGDFGGYDSEAVAPVENAFENGMIVESLHDEWQSLAPAKEITATTENGHMSKNDLYQRYDANGKLYKQNYGVAIKYGSTIKWSVGGIPWQDSGWDIFKGQQCYIYEFYTNIALSATSSNYTTTINDRFSAFPECRHLITFTTPNTAVTQDMEFTHSMTYSNGKITGNIFINTRDYTDVTYTGGTLASVLLTIYSTSAMTTVITSKEFLTSQINVGAEETQSLTVDLNLPLLLIEENKVYFTITSKATATSDPILRKTGSIKVLKDDNPLTPIP